MNFKFWAISLEELKLCIFIYEMNLINENKTNFLTIGKTGPTLISYLSPCPNSSVKINDFCHKYAHIFYLKIYQMFSWSIGPRVFLI